MKKFIVVLMMCILMTGCNFNVTKDVSVDSRYEDMIELLITNEKFATESNYYDVSYDIVKLNEGYRYYIYIDNPRIALYNVQVLAIEDGIDYSRYMAANVGIFEDTQYHLVPNQTNVDKGYVKGLMISGVTEKSELEIELMVCWSDRVSSTNEREYIQMHLNYVEE